MHFFPCGSRRLQLGCLGERNFDERVTEFDDRRLAFYEHRTSGGAFHAFYAFYEHRTFGVFHEHRTFGGARKISRRRKRTGSREHCCNFVFGHELQ